VYVNRFGSGFEDLATERDRMAVPGVEGIAPAVLGNAILEAASGMPEPALLKGVDPELEPQVSTIEEAMQAGSLADLTGRSPDDYDAVVLGSSLARRLGVQVGDSLFVMTTAETPTPLGFAPRRRPLEVVGIFQFGVFQVDDTHALVALDVAEQLLDRDGPDTLQIKLTDMDSAPAVRETLQARLGPDYLVRDWTEINVDLYSALWLEKVAISATIGLIVMVAALNIVASLVLLVMEKTRDIAILRTMGAPAAMIRRIFVFQGLTIGLIGTGAGTILGLIVCWVFDTYRLIALPGEVYQISHLPFRVELSDVVIVVVSAILVCFAATLYPSRQAGRIDPAEALRNQ
jgi:lipoprotein-releasing system permease protein